MAAMAAPYSTIFVPVFVVPVFPAALALYSMTPSVDSALDIGYSSGPPPNYFVENTIPLSNKLLYMQNIKSFRCVPI